MNATDAHSTLRLSKLPTGAPTPFRLTPDTDTLAEIAEDLDLIGLRKVRMEGRIAPQGRRDWRLEATLGATVVQPCAITLVPVTTRIDVPVLRQYLADYTPPSEAEAEMPDDDSIEPLPQVVDLLAVLKESLALALPDFPRAEGAELGEAVFSASDAEPLKDADVKPFAGLAELKKRMES